MKEKYEIGDKLRVLREYLELTQEQVAKILGTGRDAIIRIEKGIRKISAEELIELCALYRININELLNQKVSQNEIIYSKMFSKLSKNDQKEVIDLIILKNELKKNGD